MNHFHEYSDQQLLDEIEVIYKDLKQASEDENESEWHEACFAAMCLALNEMNSRGLKRIVVKGEN